MIGEMIQIGDKLSVVIENREWGYNPCKDGTIVEAIGFSEMSNGRTNGTPGIFVNHSWVKIKDENGKEWYEWSDRLSLLDPKEQEKRENIYRETENKDVFKKKIRDLPETTFYEDDVVTFEKIDLGYKFTIKSINYNYINNDGTLSKCDDGVTDMPIYSITKEGYGYTSVREEDLKLVKRGNIWNYYNGKPVKFDSISEEAEFAMKLGKYKEVRNPKCNLYSWTKEEVLEQIKNGNVHGFIGHNGLFGAGGLTISAILFNDADLGKRVAEKTLQGF